MEHNALYELKSLLPNISELNEATQKFIGSHYELLSSLTMRLENCRWYFNPDLAESSSEDLSDMSDADKDDEEKKKARAEYMVKKEYLDKAIKKIRYYISVVKAESNTLDSLAQELDNISASIE